LHQVPLLARPSDIKKFLHQAAVIPYSSDCGRDIRKGTAIQRFRKRLVPVQTVGPFVFLAAYRDGI
jgi:hypothetical protein